MVTYLDADTAPLRNTGQIRLYSEAGFAGMRKASRLTAECLDELVERVTATRLTAYAMTVSAGVTMVHFFVVKGLTGLDQGAPVYGLSLIHATLNTVLPTFMIMWSVARIGAPLTAQLGLLGPVSILFLAWLFLGEPITTLQVAGTVLVAISALVLGHRPKPRPQASLSRPSH